MADLTTRALIIGAGPYGLALSVELKSRGVEHLMVGTPMGFWRDHMPVGMFLRSSWDWHLDPTETWTIERYLQDHHMTKRDISPFALNDYLAYCDWFMQHAGLSSLPLSIDRLETSGDSGFLATASDGSTISANSVVLALGFGSFPVIPGRLIDSSPSHRIDHTLNFVDLEKSANKEVLILGGRQSAFEWAALIAEHGATAVHLVHRHPSPAFAEADWSWVPPLVGAMVDDPAWYRRLPEGQKQEISARLWREGRLKIEPWLENKIRSGPIAIHQNTEIGSVSVDANDRVRVALSDGTELHVDQIVLATGYRPDIERVSLLKGSEIRQQLVITDGFANLDEWFQTSVPGLYITSMLATQDFGPFFAFTVAARTSAKVIGRALSRKD